MYGLVREGTTVKLSTLRRPPSAGFSPAVNMHIVFIALKPDPPC